MGGILILTWESSLQRAACVLPALMESANELQQWVTWIGLRCPNGAKNSLRNTCWLGALATVISHLSYVSLLALPITIIKKIHFDPTIQPSSRQRNLSSTHSHLPTQLVAGGLKIKNDQVRPNGSLDNNLTLFQTAWHHLWHIGWEEKRWRHQTVKGFF